MTGTKDTAAPSIILLLLLAMSRMLKIGAEAGDQITLGLHHQGEDVA